jgi:hypothetical protein
MRLPWKVTFVVGRNLFLVLVGTSRDGSQMKPTAPEGGQRSTDGQTWNMESLQLV